VTSLTQNPEARNQESAEKVATTGVTLGKRGTSLSLQRFGRYLANAISRSLNHPSTRLR
jgi:hypothetical protein